MYKVRTSPKNINIKSPNFHNLHYHKTQPHTTFPTVSMTYRSCSDVLCYIWKILGCCGNAKGHCRNALCNSSIAAMMQQREHCGNALQYCRNTYCGNAEGHCKQHQHCGNIAAIRALKQALRQYAEALQQHRHCRNALRHCSNTGIAAMP